MPTGKEYRICMPLSVEEYQVGQLYMINKHSHDQSEHGEGVEVVHNEPCTDPTHGNGQFTEKRVYLNSKLPAWMQSYVPKLFYVTEKAWNFYPYTITEYTASFLPRFWIVIKTCYINDSGETENSLDLESDDLDLRQIEHLDIVTDPIPEKYYKPEEDCTKFKSTKTNRGPLDADWKQHSTPLMCSYKFVKVNFDIWGLRERVETHIHKGIRDILLVGHRQAFAWIDNWIDMTMEDVRAYEQTMQQKTNKKVLGDSHKQGKHTKQGE